MISKRFFLLVFLTAFIAVFAAAPRQTAVFAAGNAPNPEGSYKHMSIALIFPENASRAVTFARDYNLKTGPNVMDINAIFTDLTAAFQRSFKSAVRVEKKDDIKALNVDLVAVIDLQYSLPDTAENDVTYEVSVTIMTPAQTKVDAIRGLSVKSPNSFPGNNGAKRIGDAIKVAAIEAEYRMMDALYSSAKMAAFSASHQLPEKETSRTAPSQTGAGKQVTTAPSSSQ
jgi:hypothetical protein